LDLRVVCFLDSTALRMILDWDAMSRADGFAFSLVADSLTILAARRARYRFEYSMHAPRRLRGVGGSTDGLRAGGSGDGSSSTARFRGMKLLGEGAVVVRDRA
jgi:hypothetical protein